MPALLVIILIIFAVIALVCLVKALKNTSTPAAPKTSVISSTKTIEKPAMPQIRSTVGPKPSPQNTVYANAVSPNAFRCPVCDSKPAPHAKFCQVCGQAFYTKGV